MRLHVNSRVSKRGRLLRISFLLALASFIGASGCGAGGGGVLPSDQVARASLEAALSAWRDGKTPGTIAGVEPPLEVVDTPWRQGKKLASYEILREEPGTTEKRFAVRLDLKEPASKQEVQYVVLGRGPVWVYRDEDYTRAMNMEDNPKAKSAAKAGGRR
jgi:hypothetical protein